MIALRSASIIAIMQSSTSPQLVSTGLSRQNHATPVDGNFHGDAQSVLQTNVHFDMDE